MKTPFKSESEKYAAVAIGLGLPIEGDVAELGKEPVGGLMGWHELAVTVRHIEQGVSYNYPKLAESLCQHLGYALAQLDTLKGRLDSQQAELAESEVGKLELAVELANLKQAVSEDLGFLYESCGCIADSDLMDEVAAAADRLGLKMLLPSEGLPPAAQPGRIYLRHEVEDGLAPDAAPSPACLQDCSSCQSKKGGESEAFKEEARQWEEGGAYGG